MESTHVNSGRQARILLIGIQRKHVPKWPQKLKRRKALCKTLPCKHCDKGLGEQGQQIVGLGVHLMWITASFNVDGRPITIYKKVQKIHVILDCRSNLPLRQQSQLQMSQPQANTFEKTNLNIFKLHWQETYQSSQGMTRPFFPCWIPKRAKMSIVVARVPQQTRQLDPIWLLLLFACYCCWCCC